MKKIYTAIIKKKKYDKVNSVQENGTCRLARKRITKNLQFGGQVGSTICKMRNACNLIFWFSNIILSLNLPF